ncbi:putative sterigmatocystin biosynthesis peroxidase stcC [Daldinia childiae]|uniref:putative sterigmatocystin biosynthesis peroxidase stcC n=1 Tax=Daldinia childiae TaxID=326645 RepID=UPI00144820A3|nr:putative sterigmatocystin biosynthesis peroxidase stcC [Daldinia childiae]KAF3067287.1 putative sterigmatocystin biosynthesis peroxidase stcC [Daldinia childiae]
MRLISLPVAFGITLAAASEFPEGHPWIAPGPNDFRGPCPMLNTLSNHQFLPHTGRNITKDKVISAMSSALNFDESLASLMFDMATIANPEPNATFFTLDQLNVHNVLEHDGSLSRTDAFFGNNHVFNESIFNETKVYWTGEILDANMLANSKVARQLNSKAFNPNYTFTSTIENFSLGELSAPVVAFGDLEAVTVNRTLVEYFFQNERLPTELGWSTRSEVITNDIISRLTQAISNASSLITPSGAVVSTRRRDLHGGIYQ